MITPAEFVAQWEEFRAANPVLADDEDFKLRVARADDAGLRNLPPGDRQFLVEAGLPKSFLSVIYFQDVSQGLKRVWDVYSPYSWTPEEKAEVEWYFVLGSDDQDNPICLDGSKNGEIVVLDHDNYFSHWLFVNSSLNQLGEFLLVFGSSISREVLRRQLNDIDAPAMEKGTFWWSQLEP